ncbi:hypothetical protein [Endozoicomonas sp. ONNA1]|uniref:hypothetical protein n=1 Tax=Endozoicomonas sp. ONNA1 TaxID=2828740 RepID=UPI002147546E|nr:hypothetical protein [Endozoicomonas sp. ONNA1]
MTSITRLVSLMCALALSCTSIAGTSVIGRTYPIAENDALDEIKKKASKIPPEAFIKSKSDWSALKSLSLPLASATRSRKHIPWHTTQFDIKNAEGRVLYPKGFRFNPLQYVKLPQRIVVIREDHAVWLKENHLKSTDMVLLTDGDIEKVSKFIGRPVFILEDSVKQRLGLEYVPTILSQPATYFQIDEFYLSKLTPIPEATYDTETHTHVPTVTDE